MVISIYIYGEGDFLTNILLCTCVNNLALDAYITGHTRILLPNYF